MLWKEVIFMEKFVMKKSTEANIYKSIRFPVEINSQIIDIVEKANKGLDKKEYSFNGFVYLVYYINCLIYLYPPALVINFVNCL